MGLAEPGAGFFGQSPVKCFEGPVTGSDWFRARNDNFLCRISRVNGDILHPDFMHFDIDASADFYPNFDDIADCQWSFQFHDQTPFPGQIADNPPDQHPPVVGTPVAHHLPGVLAEQMGGGESPVENLFQFPQVLRRSPVIIRIGISPVNRTPIGVHHHGHIFRALHASFDFQAGHASLDIFRHHFDRLKILGTEQIFADTQTRQQIPTIGVGKTVRKSAGLGAAAAVAASAADHAGHQTLTGITNA